MKITNTFQLLVRSIATCVIGEHARYSDKRAGGGRRFKWYSWDSTISYDAYVLHKCNILKQLHKHGIYNVRVEVSKNGDKRSPAYLRHPFLVIHVKNA
jgi:hypothetical protein